MRFVDKVCYSWSGCLWLSSQSSCFRACYILLCYVCPICSSNLLTQFDTYEECICSWSTGSIRYSAALWTEINWEPCQGFHAKFEHDEQPLLLADALRARLGGRNVEETWHEILAWNPGAEVFDIWDCDSPTKPAEEGLSKGFSAFCTHWWSLWCFRSCWSFSEQESGEHLGSAVIPLLDCLPPVARNHKLNLEGETLGRRIRRLAPCPNTSHHTHTLLNTQNEYTKLIQTATGSRPRCPRTQLHEQRLNKNGIKGIEAKVEKHGKTLRPPRVYHAATMLPPCCHAGIPWWIHGDPWWHMGFR